MTPRVVKLFILTYLFSSRINTVLRSMTNAAPNLPPTVTTVYYFALVLIISISSVSDLYFLLLVLKVSTTRNAYLEKMWGANFLSILPPPLRPVYAHALYSSSYCIALATPTANHSIFLLFLLSLWVAGIAIPCRVRTHD